MSMKSKITIILSIVLLLYISSTKGYSYYEAYQLQKFNAQNAFHETCFFSKGYSCSGSVIDGVHKWATHHFRNSDGQLLLELITKRYCLRVSSYLADSDDLTLALEQETCIREVLVNRIGLLDVEGINSIGASMGDKNFPPSPIIFQVLKSPHDYSFVHIEFVKNTYEKYN